MILIRQLMHKLRIYAWLFKSRQAPLDYLSEAWISIAARWNTELNPMLSYTSMFDILRQEKFKGHFLELGGGYSTILLQNMLDMKNITLISVDLNPSKYDRILNSVYARNKFLKTIENIRQPTVSLDEVFLGLEYLRLKLAKIDKEKVYQSLKSFVHDQDNIIKEILDSIYSDNGQALKQFIETHQNYTTDLKFYQITNTEHGSAYCANIAKKKIQLDAVFFDCGEISSIGEWSLLENQIRVGGYALFHDIYYPKSIKNFLIVTYINLSEQWKILYQDKISPQGGIVAIKCQ